jgi:hypothetical protein
MLLCCFLLPYLQFFYGESTRLYIARLFDRLPEILRHPTENADTTILTVS